MYLPLISVLLENKHRLIKSDEKTPTQAPPPPPVQNGDVGSVKSDGKSTSSGNTPKQKHRSMVLPASTESAKRDSSVFDMIAGTKSKFLKL